MINALYDEIEKEYEVVKYLSFEDRDILAAINKHPEEIFSFVPRPEKPAIYSAEDQQPFIVFIDEVQYAENPSNFLKYLYDTYKENLKIIATGSSAFYIDKKFTDSLAGRKRVFELKTLDFEEWLTFKRLDRLAGEIRLINTQKDYISTVYIELLEKFYNLLTLLAGQTGNLVNRNEMANTIGVDNKTIDKYLYVLQKCFHIRIVKPFYSNLRKEITKMPKVYFNDSGMKNMALNRFFDFKVREDQGALLENYVYKRLADIYDPDNIRFWWTTDKKEIDFVVTSSFGKGMAYEVKMTCKQIKPLLKKKFSGLYPGYPAEVISYDIDSRCQWVLKL